MPTQFNKDDIKFAIQLAESIYKGMKKIEEDKRRKRRENMLLAGGLALAIGAGYLIYKMLKNGKENKPNTAQSLTTQKKAVMWVFLLSLVLNFLTLVSVLVILLRR